MVTLVSARLMVALPDTRPEPSAATTVPSTFAPLSRTVLPSMATGSDRFPVKLSPALFLPESSALDRTTFSVVPAGIVTDFGAAGFAASTGLALSADGAESTGAPALAEASSGVAFSSVFEELEQALAIARIRASVPTFQMRMVDILLIGLVNNMYPQVPRGPLDKKG